MNTNATIIIFINNKNNNLYLFLFLLGHIKHKYALLKAFAASGIWL